MPLIFLILRAEVPLPSIGPWMLLPDSTPAHWLGMKFRDRYLLEPINLIFIDTNSSTPQEAVLRLEAACAEAGYPKRFGHSTGYLGWIGGVLYTQLPTEHLSAFSDRPTWRMNNHLRVFGPAPWRGSYLFIGTISRESLDLFAPVHHVYVSFSQSRDEFTRLMYLSRQYTPAGRRILNNWMNNSRYTTGDHDGLAAVFFSLKE